MAGDPNSKLTSRFQLTRIQIQMAAETTPAIVTAEETSGVQLRKTLRMRDLVLLIVGTVIGSGIFLVPGAVLKQVGYSVPLALAVWLAGGLLSLLGALTYG